MDGSHYVTIKAPSDGALLAVLNQSQDCIKILSVSGTLEFMNENGRKVMEIDSLEQVLGLPWESLWPEDSQVMISDAVTRALDGMNSRFEAFCPTAKGTQRWWDVSVSPILDNGGQITHIMSTSRDMTETRMAQDADRARADAAEQATQIQTVVALESRHRLKNLLTVVSSLSALVSRHAKSVDDFQAQLRTHLYHIGRAQDLLIGTDQRTVTLRETVMAVLEADKRLRISDIPEVYIGDQAVQILALSLGELQTNAMKHGALGVDGGSVTLRLTETNGTLQINWTEDCGEDRPEPDLTQGAGLQLIQRMISMQSETVDFNWTGRGLQVAFKLPAF